MVCDFLIYVKTLRDRAVQLCDMPFRMLFLLLLLLQACQNSGPDLQGAWQVKNTFYQATYELVSERDGLHARMLSYDDGTTHYQQMGSNERYLFKSLRWQKEAFVDGLSGATQAADTYGFRVWPESPDVLRVSQRIGKKVREERWTRIVR